MQTTIYDTPEHQTLREQVARFIAKEVEPHAQAWEEQGMVPREVLQRMGRAGLLGLMYEEQYGGGQADALTNLVFAEALSQSTFAGFIITVLVHTDMASPHLHHAGTPEQKAKYMPRITAGECISAVGISEPGAGSDVAGIRTSARREGDEWVINGTKMFITNGVHADVYFVAAKTGPGKRDMSIFIVDKGTPGFNVLRRIPMLGGHFTYEIALEDLRLPHTAMLGEEGKGFAPMQERLSNRRVQMAAWCTGRAQRALDMMVEYAPQRSTFGVPLSERQAIQWWIADAATRIHACRLMTHEAAWRIDTGRDARSQVSMIKAYATEMAWEIIDRAMQTFGAMGMTKELPLQQMANDVRLMRVYEGPTEVHRWVVARNTLAGRG